MNQNLSNVKKEPGMELLAPAGSPEAGYAALHYGADALYLGLSSFSARASAVNFSVSDLAGIVGFAHSLPKRRKIYAAVNTLVLENELGSVIELLADIAALGVDAVIIQDLGVLSILRRYFPQLKIHASTQMAIHNRPGVEAAVEMGIGRVTLARELTLSEIADIAAVPGIETEVFIHGALCYSYSGLCLFSSHLYGRSGNRGRCAYPCREWFRPAAAQTNGRDGAPSRPKSEERMPQTQASPKAPPRRGGIPTLTYGNFKVALDSRLRGNDRTAAQDCHSRPDRESRKVAALPPNLAGQTGGFIFSMKDLALPEYVTELRRIGVTALKIEGRMKSPLYVAAVTNYYRKLIDGRLTPQQGRELAAELKTIYSRPWTDLYIKNHKNRNVIDPEIVGHRGFPTGKAEKIVKSGQGHCLRFKTGLSLELHDGLQIDIKGWPRPFGFAVKSIYIREDRPGRKEERVFEAPAGSTVEVPLPRGHPAIPLGAVIYSASSQQVKQKYKFNAPKAGQFRPRQETDFIIRIDSKGFEVMAGVDIKHGNSKKVGRGVPALTRGERGRTSEAEGSAEPSGETAHPEGSPYLWNSCQEIPAKVGVTKRFVTDLPPARDPNQVEAAVKGAFSKLGDTNLKLGRLVVDNSEMLFIPISALNAARREITAALEQKMKEVTRKYTATIKSEMSSDVIPDMSVSGHDRESSIISEKIVLNLDSRLPFGLAGSALFTTGQGGHGNDRISKMSKSVKRLGGEFGWSIKTDEPRLLEAFDAEDWKDVDEIIIECVPGSPPEYYAQADRISAIIGREKVRFALPVIMREWETENTLRTAKALILKGWKKWQVSNLGGWALLTSLYMDLKKVGRGVSPSRLNNGSPSGFALPMNAWHDPGLNISSDWPLYTMNLAAVEQLKAMGMTRFTLSPEDGLENMRAILQSWFRDAVVVVYQDTPLMISATCVFAGGKHSCRETCERREASYVSPRSDDIRVVSHGCRNVVLNGQPFSLAGRLDELEQAGALNLRVDFLGREYTGNELRDIWRRLRSGGRISPSRIANFERGML